MSDETTTEQPETAEETESDEFDVRGQVRDTESKNQLSRLQGVHEAWTQCLDRRTLAADHGQTQEALRYYRVGIERLLLEIESVATRADAMQVWKFEKLGVITLPVPEEIQNAYQRRDVRILSESRPPEPARAHVRGLQGLLETDWPVSQTWELTISAGGGQRDTIVATSEAEPPMELLDKAVRKLRGLLGAVGLDLELGGSYRAIGGGDAL